MLIRLTAPQIATVVAAMMVIAQHSSAYAQALKPVAVHAAQSPSAGQGTAPPAANQYVGESTCVTCHDQKLARILSSRLICGREIRRGTSFSAAKRANAGSAGTFVPSALLM